MKSTAFVSHSDCSLHDPGWGHVEHQGRLPGLVRAVYRDMLTLFEPLLEVEGRHAEESELELVHTGEYLSVVKGWVEEAARLGRSHRVGPDLAVSAASWAASTAAVGSCLVGSDTVLEGRVRNAFCAARPPGRDATAEAPGRFGFLNALAVTVRHLRRSGRCDRVLVIMWGRTPDPGSLLAGEPAVRVATVVAGAEEVPESDDTASGELVEPAAGGRWLASMEREVGAALADFQPDIVVVSAGFDEVVGDPVGGGSLRPVDYHRGTVLARQVAEQYCEGRLVSILEGGYDPSRLGEATVHHLRALAGLDPPT